MYTYKDAMGEFRLMFDSGDAWGSAMNMWFAIADEVYFNRDMEVPTEWNFKPSPIGPANDPDDYATEIVTNMSDDALSRFGAVMHRYVGVLKHAGVDY